ncbi:HAMP domain-containing protein [Burkholderiaceae bacterium DAT-1]|nr:HAMP domain-containing protein [Burkholderiaceae bacterium DAT-1]
MRSMRNVFLVVGSLAAILLFMLATASGDNRVFETHYPRLVWLNGLMVLALGAMVGNRLWRLRLQVKARLFGSRLAWRMTLMFALVAILPGILLYTMSVQFLTKSIESWFDPRVESALERGLTLGSIVLDNSLKDLRHKADIMAEDIGNKTKSEALVTLTRLREYDNVREATLFDSKGRIIVDARDELAAPFPEAPSATELRQIADHIPIQRIVNAPPYGLAARVLVRVAPGGFFGEARVLQLIQPIPQKLAADTQLVEEVRTSYKALEVQRDGLKKMFGETLTLALLLALLGAVVLGMYLSEKLSAPLNVLAAGTRAVAQGDFSQMQPVVSRDELGILTHSFNRMTRQLADARAQVERQQREQSAAKAYLETVLGNLTAGVLAFDERWRLRSGNISAEGILHASLDVLTSLRLWEWREEIPHLEAFANCIQQEFDAQRGQWLRQVEISHDAGTRMLLLRGTQLPGDAAGAVVVFDDVTDLLRAQRDAAWGEVAKRLAHEIRNPLTPIQLAAERLDFKLAEKLEPADADFLGRSTRTIVSQVAALKKMVDAFREYARQPATKLAPLNLSELLDEVLGLYEESLIVRHFHNTDPIMIVGDATLLRQVVHNLLKNAQEAVGESPDGRIVIRTESVANSVRLSVEDNGPGFDDAILQRIFEPYATTKKKGTGLGLAIVKKIIDEHHGQIAAMNLEPHGAAVRIDLPVAASQAA